MGRADRAGAPGERDGDRQPRDPRRRPRRARSTGRCAGLGTRRCTWSTPRATWAGRSPPSGRRASSTGSRRPFRALREAHPHPRPVDSDLWFWRVHSLPDVLGAGRATSRRSGCTSSPCRPRGRARGAVAPVLPGLRHRPGASGSRSAGGQRLAEIEEIAVLREPNKRLEEGGDGRRLYGRLVREGIAQGVLAQRPGMRRASWDPATATGRPRPPRAGSPGCVTRASTSSATSTTCGRSSRRRPRSGATPTGPGLAVVRDAAMTALTGAVLEASQPAGPGGPAIARPGSRRPEAARALSGPAHLPRARASALRSGRLQVE